MRIHIGGLKLGCCSPTELKNYLEEMIGPVQELRWPRGVDGQRRTFAFVDFVDPAHGEKAIMELHNSEWGEITLNVSRACG